MAFIEPLHRNKPNITYLLTSEVVSVDTFLHYFPTKNILSHQNNVKQCHAHISFKKKMTDQKLFHLR